MGRYTCGLECLYLQNEAATSELLCQYIWVGWIDGHQQARGRLILVVGPSVSLVGGFSVGWF